MLMFGNTYMYNSYKLFRSCTINFFMMVLSVTLYKINSYKDQLVQRPTRTKTEKLICTRTFVQVWYTPRNKVRQIYCTTFHLDKTIKKNSVVHVSQEETARCLIFNSLIVLGVYTSCHLITLRSTSVDISFIRKRVVHFYPLIVCIKKTIMYLNEGYNSIPFTLDYRSACVLFVTVCTCNNAY